jgi:hypothetical protein
MTVMSLIMSTMSPKMSTIDDIKRINGSLRNETNKQVLEPIMRRYYDKRYKRSDNSCLRPLFIKMNERFNIGDPYIYKDRNGFFKNLQDILLTKEYRRGISDFNEMSEEMMSYKLDEYLKAYYKKAKNIKYKIRYSLKYNFGLSDDITSIVCSFIDIDKEKNYYKYLRSCPVNNYYYFTNHRGIKYYEYYLKIGSTERFLTICL